MPVMLAGIVDYEMAVPPRELLGSFHTPGQPEALAEWLLSQNEGQDCLILSLDMLLYGGLVASRQPDTLPEVARRRLGLLPALREKFPEAAIYASSILSRLDFSMSPEDRLRYGDAFYRYTRLGGAAQHRAETRQLLASLPESLVENYRQVRRRNHELNGAAVDAVARGHLDFLLLGQDDADATGFHVAEQRALRAQIRREKLSDRVVTCAGADETAATLLSRFVHAHMEAQPQVAVLYLDPEAAEQIAPYEDRPFAENLRAQAEAAGVQLVDDLAGADMILAISPPVLEPRQGVKGCPENRLRRKRLAQFAKQVAKLSERRGVAICDAAFPNGAEEAFVEALKNAGLPWTRLLAFSAWNTAGNSLGTALAHGAIRLIGLRDKAAFDLAQLVTSISPMRYFELLNSLLGAEKAHLSLLFTRIVDDWLYQSRVRPVVKERLADMVGMSSLDLTEVYPRAEEMVRELLTQDAVNLWVEEFMGEGAGTIGPPDQRSGLALAELQETRVRLPWRRLFEVELEFDLGLELTVFSKE
jgi:hypothetical protein